MKAGLSTRVFSLVVLLVAVGACNSGPPSISDLKLGKDKEVSQASNAFDAHDTLYAVAKIDNPPENAKVIGRLAVVDVAGQTPGPIPTLEMTLDLTAGMNTANFNFSAPTAGWPDGKYKLEVVLLDATGAEKSQQSAEFATSGNTSAVPAAEIPAAEAPASDTATEAPAADATQT